MDLKDIIRKFESDLNNIGFNNESSLFLMINIEGKSYIHSRGSVNINTNSNEIDNKRIEFTTFMLLEIEKSQVRPSTKKIHRDTYRIIHSFSPILSIENINQEYLFSLTSYMREHKLSINTIAKHMKVLKRYINLARKKNIISSNPFSNYRIQSEKTYREFLTEKELQKVEEYVALNPKNEVMLAFLFSCYTGLRYSDVITLTRRDIIIINRKRWLIKKMQKTNYEVRVPLTIFNGKALEIIKTIHRNKGKIFKISSPQQTNREIARVIKFLSIHKNITFHSARHTCATLLIYRGVSITTVQKILGHKNITTTQIYSAITDLTIENDIKMSNKKQL